jgi:hypothetical protein
MSLTGKAYTREGVISYKVDSAGHTCDTIFIMTQYGLLSEYYYKEEIIDLARASCLEEALARKFLSTAIRMNIKDFYVFSGSGEIFHITIEKKE